MNTPHIVLYGHFGVGNLGNDTTLEAAVHNIRKLQPSAVITCVCRGPRAIAERYGISTLPVDVNEDRDPGQLANPNPNILSRLASRIVDEIDFWVRRTLWFRSVDQFIVVGTGAIYDSTAPPWNMPYDLFKWCRAARLGGAKVVFLSVGAGPIEHPASRVLMLNALRGATYRSYRDTASINFLQSVGFDTKNDHLYPDLVFSLPMTANLLTYPLTHPPRKIGLGVIAYYGPHHDTIKGEPIYRQYIDKMKRFLSWLLSQGYSVRLLTGDLENDPQPAYQLLKFIRNEGAADWQERIVAEPIRTVDDLSTQIAQTDMVVASRFHNLIAAVMLGRPVISIGFHEKNTALMAQMSLDAYCQHIEQLDVDRLIEQFQSLSAQSAQVSAQIQQKSAQFRQLLDEQYCRVLFPEQDHVAVSVKAA